MLFNLLMKSILLKSFPATGYNILMNAFGPKKWAAIKNKSKPSSDWKLHSIKVISKQMFSNYNETSKCADKTLVLYSSASEAELINTSNKRKRSSKVDFNDLSSGSDEERQTYYNIPDFPNFTSR